MYKRQPKIPLRIGNSARWFSYKYNKKISIRRSKALLNEAEYNWLLLRLVDSNLHHSPINESLNIEDFKAYRKYPELKNHTVIMPGVSVSAIAWKKDHWIDLAKKIPATEKVLLLLGPAEKDLANNYKQGLKDHKNIEVRVSENYQDLIGLSLIHI